MLKGCCVPTDYKIVHYWKKNIVPCGYYMTIIASYALLIKERTKDTTGSVKLINQNNLTMSYNTNYNIEKKIQQPYQKLGVIATLLKNKQILLNM